ncbi:MAG TPA: hypothetical protein VF384_17315 [Planctomycetota bacterium]
MRPYLLASILSVACSSPAPPPPVEPARLLVDGSAVPLAEPRVLSVDDANERYQVTMRSAMQLGDTGHTVSLQIGAAALPSSSWGRDGDETWFVFAAEAAMARTAAAALGVEAVPRGPWPVSLSARVEAAGALTPGQEQLPLRFTLRNDGPVAVWFLDGGRQRNQLGRDNRFEVGVQRGSAPLAIRRVEDFGGIGQYRRIDAGQSWVFTPDLAHWCLLDQPGEYALRISYEAELMPAEFEPGAQLALGLHSHLQRTRRIAAEARLEVR